MGDKKPNSRIFNLRSGCTGKYSIKNEKDHTAVHIYDEISQYGVTAKNLVDDISQIKGPIKLHLNSPGGDVFEGIAIYNVLKQRGNISVVIDGYAASIASVIAMAADPGKLSIGKHASMMIHDAFSQAAGNGAEMIELGNLLNQQSDNIAGIYANRTGKPVDYWRNAMKKETWYIGEDAVDAGLADKLIDVPVAKNRWDMAVFKNAVALTTDDSGWILDEDGTVRFDPDGDGDDDSRPETDTDHGWWDEYGGLMKPIPPMPKEIRKALKKMGKKVEQDDDDDEHDDDEGMKDRVRRLLNEGVDTSAWDAAKAWHNGANSDDPAAFYKAICAGRKAGDPTKQSSWALPYRYTPSSAPNAAAVRNALARLDQTQGLVNKAQAKSLLQKLMKKINPEYQTTDAIDPQLFQAALLQALGGRNGE